jgi:hypothetical protein
MDEKMGELELSSRYGLGVSRISAILRLKKLEQLWIKVNFLVPLRWNRDEHQSISLEDYYMVKKTLHMHGFLILTRLFFPQITNKSWAGSSSRIKTFQLR